MKNGGFSDKYRFNLCTPGPDELGMAENLINMNYDALCFSADGITEVCVRELIPHNEKTTPCIYQGMPLRPEFRVFYDFDRHQPLYAVNYWDWDYCYKAISRNPTDKIVYEAVYPQLESRYQEVSQFAMELVEKSLANVTGLKGIWSVDLMEVDNRKFYLIDMALGASSAYWDQERVKAYLEAAS